MILKFSRFGRKLTARSGILELMEDLGEALNSKREMIMLGGGNPAHIPGIQKILRQRMRKILKNGDEFERMIGNYDPPQGNVEFIAALVRLFNQRFGWKLKPSNVCLTNGSQNTFFFLFNMLAGEFDNGSHRQILLPLMPEYIGYADQGLDRNFFRTTRPVIEMLDEHTFKYRVDFGKLECDSGVAAMCVSRPTNPTGNVLTDAEIAELSRLSRKKRVPLIIDNAYGAPFPNIIFSKAEVVWDEHIILTMSFSKFGLPATRIGVVVASEEVVRAITGINSIVSLANGSVGTSLMQDLVASAEILRLSEKVVCPFYEKRAREAIRIFHAAMDPAIPYRLHRCEGSLFLWLWCENLPISDRELYERLKKLGVLVVPGNAFFMGSAPRWKHSRECIRINYSQEPAKVERGLKIIAGELKRVYTEGS